jgi:hypothetical protein
VNIYSTTHFSELDEAVVSVTSKMSAPRVALKRFAGNPTVAECVVRLDREQGYCNKIRRRSGLFEHTAKTSRSVEG